MSAMPKIRSKCMGCSKPSIMTTPPKERHAPPPY
jgi:hypothetical protein